MAPQSHTRNLRFLATQRPRRRVATRSPVMAALGAAECGGQEEWRSSRVEQQEGVLELPLGPPPLGERRRESGGVVSDDV